MEYLLILKNGIGNKIFALVNILHKYPKTNFYVVEQQSHHKDAKFISIFPALKDLKYIKFIDWKQYDKLKDTIELVKDRINLQSFTTKELEKQIAKITSENNINIKKEKNGILIQT